MGRFSITATFALAVVLVAAGGRALFAKDNKAAEPAAGITRVACVGDSITAGVGAKGGESYPSQLGRMLGEKFEVGNFGTSGATLLNHGDLPYQKKGALKPALAFNPDVVVIMLGTNDTKPQNWKFKDEFADDYKDLISKFAALPSKPRIFLCQPVPVPGAGNYGINEKGVDEEMPMIEKVAAETHTTIIDTHAALAGKDDLIPDRVHPNTGGATLMAKAVYQAIANKPFEADAPVKKSAEGGK